MNRDERADRSCMMATHDVAGFLGEGTPSGGLGWAFLVWLEGRV